MQHPVIDTLSRRIWITALAVAWHAAYPLPCPAQHVAHNLTSTTRHTVGQVGRARVGRNLGEGYSQPVQIIAPMGSLISVAENTDFAAQYPAPAMFGLQVTNTYRFRISEIPLLEGVTLYPTVELIDRLHPPPGRKQLFPVPIELTMQELRQAAAGDLVTRVIYLDHPKNPSFETPVQNKQPYFEVFADEDPLVVADELGRPIAILRMGAKSPGPNGPTPGFTFHSPPVEPLEQLCGAPLEGMDAEGCAPILCPADVYGEKGYPRDEYLCDGGDGFFPSSVNLRGEVLGLEPSETIARFTTVSGETGTSSSTRVCIYAPRFAATRRIVQANQESIVDHIGSIQKPFESQFTTHDLRPTPATRHLELQQANKTRISRTLENQNQGRLLENRNAALANVQKVLPHANLTEISATILETQDLTATLDGTANAIAWSSAQAIQVVLEGAVAGTQVRYRQPQAVEIYEMPPGTPRLRLVKLASVPDAQRGAEVTFTIRFTNLGETPLHEVAILDNLLPRLVYVEGSQQCTLPAGFDQAPASEGSSILTWSLIEPLNDGQGGEISFRCRAE